MVHFRFWLVLLLKCVYESYAMISEINNSYPSFTGPINNVTVPVGRDALLTCVVHALTTYKIAWLRVDTQTILSIQNHVITKNLRIGISHTEHRIWQLRIRDVSESDRGWYMCQINTDPMKSQVGYLDVVVPPDIIDLQTSSDMTINEGQNGSLICSAKGLPKPTIAWRRENDLPLRNTTTDDEVSSIEGNNLILWSVTRETAGVYLCIASNGVPPTVSKRIQVTVNFAPTMTTRYDTIYASMGQKLLLDCTSESYPAPNNVWLKDMDIVEGGIYESFEEDNIIKILMRLTIQVLKPKDLGEYRCQARNFLGEAERTITIHHKSKMQIHHLHQKSEMGNKLVLIEEYVVSVGPYSHDIDYRVLFLILACLQSLS